MEVYVKNVDIDVMNVLLVKIIVYLVYNFPIEVVNLYVIVPQDIMKTVVNNVLVVNTLVMNVYH